MWVAYYSSWFFFFFKQKTAYEMRISDWSSDVCSSDLPEAILDQVGDGLAVAHPALLVGQRSCANPPDGARAAAGPVAAGPVAAGSPPGGTRHAPGVAIAARLGLSVVPQHHDIMMLCDVRANRVSFAMPRRLTFPPMLLVQVGRASG